MPPPEVFMPATANLLVVICVGLGFFLVFYLVFVRWLRIGKVAWKRMDYIWLGVASIGLIGSVGQVRILVALAQLDMSEKRAMSSFSVARRLIGQYASSPGVVCRKFIRTEFSPPPKEMEKTQKEYDLVCEWLQKIHSAIQEQSIRLASPPKRIDWTVLPPRPKVTGAELNSILRDIDSQVAYFDEDLYTYEHVRELSKRTELENTFVVLGPSLLAVAIAIRFAKVSGEIALEKQAQPAIPPDSRYQRE
jgi:hypothetical protein